jgi:hypothetical protein
MAQPVTTLGTTLRGVPSRIRPLAKARRERGRGRARLRQALVDGEPDAATDLRRFSKLPMFRGVEVPSGRAHLRWATRINDRLSLIVDRCVPRPRIAAGWLAAALTCYLVIHYAGLRTAFEGEGKLHRLARVSGHLHLSDRVYPIGETQPVGAFEDLIPVVVTALLVTLLTSAVRQLRSHPSVHVEDRLPRQLSAVVLVALVRPRRVVDAIWLSSGPLDGREHSRGAPGSRGLDILWPIWLFTNVAIHYGDQLSADAKTISDMRLATWIEVVAELGFLATGALLLLLTAAISRRPGVASPRRVGARKDPANVAAFVIAPALLVLTPVLAIDLKAAYLAEARGPSFSELQQRIAVDRLWRIREQAAAAGDARRLAKLEVGAALQADMAGLRRERAKARQSRFARDLVGVRPIMAPNDERRLLAVVNTFGGPGWEGHSPGRATELLVMSRQRAGSPWRVSLEVPFRTWPWQWNEFRAATHARTLSPADGHRLLRAALRPTLQARKWNRTTIDLAAVIPLQRGRVIVCGAASPPSRSDLVQACVAGAPGMRKPILLGELFSGRP